MAYVNTSDKITRVAPIRTMMMIGKVGRQLRTTAVKLQGRLEGDALSGRASAGVSLLGSVEGVDVSLMMFLVMQLHDLT